MDTALLKLILNPLLLAIEDVQNRVGRLEQQVAELHVMSGRVDLLIKHVPQVNVHVDTNFTQPTTVTGNMHGDIVQGNQTKTGT
jgi:hypothetical protein